MCNRPEDGHTGIRHPFTPPGVAQSLEAPEQTGFVRTAQAVDMPFDPVLRMALINKGVLTPDDLTEAERIMTAISGRGGDLSDARDHSSRS
jgi:hypothetical protein